MVAAPPASGLPRAFRNLFVSNLATNLGDGVIRTASPLLAIRLTSDPLLIAVLAGLALLPWLFFAIPAGIIVDRVDRRVALRMANGVRVVLATGLVVLYATHSLSIWWLFAVAFIDGSCETIYDGAIRAMMPSIVAKPLLPGANSRIEAGELILQNFLAAPLTSLLFAVAVLIPLGANIGLYALAVILALLLPRAASGRQFTAVAADSRPKWYRQLVDGYRFITANRMLKTLWFFSTFTGLCYSAATASLVLFLVRQAGLPPALFGTFLLTGAAGGVLGSFFAARLNRRLGLGLTMACANLLTCLALLSVGLFPILWVSAVAFFVSSFALLNWNVLIMTLRQSLVPGARLGRVHGTWRTLLWGTMPLGSVIGGLLARIDLALPFQLAGGASALAAVVFFRFLTTLPNAEDVDNGDHPDAQFGLGAEAGLPGLPLED